MKKYFCMMVAVLLIGGSLTMNAQQVQNDNVRKPLTEEQMIEKRTDRMAQMLMLDDATAAKFAPVYSQYLKEKMDCRKMKTKHFANGGNAMNTKTDAEVDEMIQANFAQSQKMLDIREKYYAKLHKILTPKQIMRIYQVEKSDVGKMKKEIQRRRGQKRPQNQ
jgi:hypothetical protein